ncbi:hypothetical protein MUK42_18588 [Musa troglodytarum]|uniref:BTB domain-containing protein n=1 Tax=Musa troglodytarum TaxID=320322 RepID=A0A9E7JE84_9LILI|nr:hypothetical protein MUK42_18588 [Musa troglodytarum]
MSGGERSASDSKVETISRYLSVEKNRYVHIRLFPEPSRVSKEQPPVAKFVLRVSSPAPGRRPCISPVNEKLIRSSEDFAWAIDSNFHGRFTIDVEFLDLKIHPLDGGEACSIWPNEGMLQSLSSKSTLRCLSRMLEDGIHADVTIKTSDGVLKAHKAVLASSSPVFESMFLHDLKEKESSTIKIEDMSLESCSALLGYIYGTIKQEDFWKHRLALLGAANKYDIADLKDCCEESLLEDINSSNRLRNQPQHRRSMLRQFSVLPPPPLPSRSPPLRPVPRLLLPSDGFSLYLLHSRRRRRRRPLVIVLRSGGGDRWRLTDLDPNAVQDRLRSWLLKARTLLTEVATPLVKPGQGRKLATARELENMDVEEEVFVASEMTVDRRTTNGFLSFAAVVSIEQFARMNGLTGRKMQKIFEALAPETIRTDARSLVEYCCFRYLSRDSSDIHPSLKEHAFQRLIFVTMLAWEQPYTRDGGSQILQDASSFQGQLVGEDAFVRIAPAVAGVSDVSTAHHLFKALAGDEQGISLRLWTTYLAELLKVHQGRQSYENGDFVLPYEQLLCIGSSRKRPVLKWENNIAWPGNLTLTNKALYFEIEKTKVGPFASKLFDSAVSVSSGLNSETWILEFVDFGGEMRRDVWHAFIREIISLYEFLREYGPDGDDPSIHDVYGAHKGKRRAIRSAANNIARLQCLQFIRKLSEDPAKLVQFSYLRNVPYGDVVFQTLAVSFWGGPLVTKFKHTNNLPVHRMNSVEDLSGSNVHLFDVDGSVYLRKWMKSPSWSSSSSITFWKNSLVKHGIVLAKNLVVADLSLVERAALTCKEKSRIVEKTQATIDAAMIKGIPSNIDLFKELMLPLAVVAQKFDKLRRWEKPRLTISFLVFAYTIIFRNLLSYVLPATLIVMATTMLLLKGLKEQGRLGRFFGRVVIRDQPPSNTIQKIIALKEAMAYVENYLQNINVILLKIRTIMLSVQPEVTFEVAVVLLGSAIILLVIPFKYILAFIIFDLFTRELQFRKEMVVKFVSFLRERWAGIHAAPVVVLPYESPKTVTEGVNTTNPDRIKSERILGNGSAAKS